VLVASAWLTLWVWSGSPYGRYIDHGRWTDIGIAGQICRMVPAGDVVVPALLYAAGWLTMIAAMMLPTTLPLLEILRRVTAGRPDAGRLVVLVICGYLCAWLGFGLAAHAADGLLHAGVARMPWLAANGWAIGAAVLAAAGFFQFSALKYRCLDKCRTPFGFVVERWRGRSPAGEAWRLGMAHGLFCVGCCWALMLLMFVVGSASVGWMLALSGVMAIEKNLPWGHRVSAPLGLALIAWAGALLLFNAGPFAG
jgi:predicted metal-binding membrane protein